MEGGDAVSTVLRVKDVRVRRGAREVLAGVSFDVPRGAIVALMGPSGSGKTTMLRAIAGLEPLDAGTIDVAGVTLTAATPRAATLRALHRTAGLVFQFHHLFEHLTVLENVCLAPVHAYGVRRPDAERRARELLARLHVEHRAGVLPRELSGGEAQRAAIARALAVDPPLLMLDEPTASLDPARRAALGELLRDLADDHRTLLVSTHDEAFAREWTRAVLRVEHGTITGD
jgi:ABC-type polar amino acid transport system ATPase subunit